MFKYSIMFNVCNPAGIDLNWVVPVDAGYGGFTMFDNQQMSSASWDLDSNSQPGANLDFSVFAAAGPHVMELYGMENCCDGTTS